MKTFARLALPAAFALAAVGAQAGTLEIDYPVAAATDAPVLQYTSQQASPFLIQSNFEGPKVDPTFAKTRTVTQPVRPAAEIAKPWGPGHNA